MTLLSTIPMGHPSLRQALQVIPEEFHPDTWIAGSAAARFEQAWAAGGDLDLWVCAGNDHVKWNRIAMAPFVETPILDHDDKEYSGAAIHVYAQDRIHILVSPRTIQQVVDDFDISCHAAAMNVVSWLVYIHPKFTSEVRILQWHNPRITFGRGAKFSSRYRDHSFWDDDQTLRCALAAFGLPTTSMHGLRTALRMAVPEGL